MVVHFIPDWQVPDVVITSSASNLQHRKALARSYTIPWSAMVMHNEAIYPCSFHKRSSITAELLLLQIILTEKKNVVDFCLLSSLTTTKNVLIFICIRYIDSNLNLKEIYFLTQNNEVHIFW